MFLGLAALATPFALQTGCGGEVIGTGVGGASGTSTTDSTTVGPSTTGPSTTTTGPATATVTTTISAYATSATVSTSTGPMACDGSGDCGDSMFGCIGCALSRGCADEYDACATDADCVAYAECTAACPDPACVDQCAVDHPGGAMLYDALAQCVYCDECYVDCDGPAQGCP